MQTVQRHHPSRRHLPALAAATLAAAHLDRCPTAVPSSTVLVLWGGTRLHWTTILFTCGRNFDMDSVTKDKLPVMITTREDEYAGMGDDMIKAAEEAFEYLIRASGSSSRYFV